MSSGSKFSLKDALKQPARVGDRRALDRPRFSRGWAKDFTARFPKGRNAPVLFGGVEVWTAQPKSLLRSVSCLQILDDADRSELGAIADCATREASTAGRMLLRLALSRASKNEIEASSWHFERLESGRLQITKELPQIQFSISHCKSLVGVAVSPKFDVGVDIESVNFRVTTAIQKTYLANAERSYLASLKLPQSLRGTLRLWTLKEAFAKLIGVGLQNDFRDIEFQLSADVALTTVERFSLSSTCFESLYLDIGDDLYLATLAVGSKSSRAAGQIQFLNLLNDAPASVPPFGRSRSDQKRFLEI